MAKPRKLGAWQCLAGGGVHRLEEDKNTTIRQNIGTPLPAVCIKTFPSLAAGISACFHGKFLENDPGKWV